MSKLEFREITRKNFYEIIKLSNTLTEEQKKCVAPNSYSIAQGSVYSNAYYRGNYSDEKPVGFFMLSIPNDDTREEGDNEFYLWRFMIAHDEQHKHYGSRTLDHIKSIAKKEGHNKIVTSCQMGEVSPYKFYLKYGFIDTGKVDDGEQVLELEM